MSEEMKTRGVEVKSWGIIEKETCIKVLKVSSTKLYNAYLEFNKSSIRNGCLGMNINASNIIAAIFISCGQDVASATESSWSQLTIDIDKNENLHLFLYTPRLLVGTVGSRTNYETQKRSLEMLKCHGNGKKLALAETIAAFCLALDVSTLASFAQGSFANVYKKLSIIFNFRKKNRIIPFFFISKISSLSKKKEYFFLCNHKHLFV